MRSRLLPAVLAGSLSVALALPPSTALAVPPRGTTGGTTAGAGSSDGAAWRQLFEQGRQHHEAGRYEDAAEAFYRAHEAGGPASLLYNQALCLDRLERVEAAVAAYRGYLDASPSAANREEVQERIAELERAEAPQPSGRLAPRIAAPSGPVMQLMPLEGGFEMVVVGEGRPIARPPETDPVRIQEAGPEWVASWFFLLGTLGSAGAAIGVGIDGQASFDAFRADCAAIGGCTQEEIDAASAHTSATITNVLLVTTAVLGTATVISFLVEGLSTSGPRVYAEVTPQGLRLRGSF